MSAARRGDREALGQAIDRRERTGEMSAREAASLAKAVAERDLSAAPPDEVLARVRDCRPCARELDGALADRMRVHDAAGAAAALARLEARGLDPGDARAFASDPDGAWRAVGARALVRSDDRGARLSALHDGDPGVRREAVRAARDAADMADVPALLEAARVDPDSIVRTEAVRAIAAAPATRDGATATALRDVWTGGDGPLRAEVAIAWAAPSIWAAGGRDALRVVVAESRGMGAIEAAAAVLRHRDADAEVTQLAEGQLARSIALGSRAERLQAIAQVPLDRREIAAAVAGATSDSELDVRVSALARLAAMGDARARADLEALGQPGSAVAARARLALAGAGDRRVQAWLESDLRAAQPEDRVGAAVALAALGMAGRAAPLLADPDRAVRARAACAILMAARAGR